MAESDDMREEMRNAITIALTLASAAQHQLVRARERARDDAQARVNASRSEAQATAALAHAHAAINGDHPTQTPVADEQRFAQVSDPGWWESASAEQVAAAWSDIRQASDSNDPEVVAAAERAANTMSEQLHERYDIDPTQVDATVDQQLNGREDRGTGEAPSDGLMAGPAQSPDEATPVSPDDRRAQLGDRDAPGDAVETALAVADAFPHRTNQVHHRPVHETTAAPAPGQHAHKARGVHRG